MMIGVEPITMNRGKARELWQQYKAHCKSKHTAEDRGIMLGYRALAQGKSVIDIYDVFRKCPADANGLPKLAIGRANWERCWYFRYEHDNDAVFASTATQWGQGKNTATRIVVPRAVMNPACSRYVTDSAGVRRAMREGDGRAIVPIIPPNVRPKASLKRYHILWEAEWDVVPRDPMLLRQLHGSLYAVLAVWDLTDLERAVLSHRL